MKNPLVSIILTSYNQERFVADTIRSVIGQTYSNIQLIVIENGSTDSTWQALKDVLNENETTILIRNTRNVGLCKAFNQGLALSKGKYVIDLSGDDLFCPERIERQVEVFERLEEDYAVLFSNAEYIDVHGKFIKNHYLVDKSGRSIYKVPSGNVFKEVLHSYFICTPTMMMRTSILKAMNGYDENLLFEDFDFWVRSSARYRYHYQDEVLTRKRVTPGSLSTWVYVPKSRMLESYLKVCFKAYNLSRNKSEFDVLANRIRTFIRKCFYAQEFDLAFEFFRLLNYIEEPGLKTKLVISLCKICLPVNTAYQFYIRNFQKYLGSREVLRPGSVKTES